MSDHFNMPDADQLDELNALVKDNEQLEADLAEARAQIAEYKTERSYVHGWNAGFEEAQEQARAQIAAKDELIRSFVLDMIDYMTKNDLGDPEQMHNIKWARKLGCHDTLETSDDPR